MKRISICLVLMVCLGCPVFAQTGSNNAPSQNAPGTNANNGNSMQVNLNVGDKVTAQAVLIPKHNVKRIFGKEIADHYAVIQLVVGNRSNEAALIIHGIYIDYSQWALSGTRLSVNSGGLTSQGRPFQAQTKPNHIASEEYRIVRGQLLDAQHWTKRNWTVRLLTLAGSLASGYSFSLKEKGIIEGFSVFNGTFLPGFKELWPDGSEAQINRVSDFGFRANKVIPQQGSDIIVCFFPLDRFLSPGFRDLFQKSPALFFAPFQMLLDETLKPDVARVLGQELGLEKTADEKVRVERLRQKLACYLRLKQSEPDSSPTAAATNSVCSQEFGLKMDSDGKLTLIDNTEKTVDLYKDFLLLDYISQTSLNTVTVVVDGVLTIDTANITAKVDDIEFENADKCGDPAKPCFWTKEAANGVRKGTISGSYLTGGRVKIVEAEEYGITKVETAVDKSSDQELHFSFSLAGLTKPIKSGTKLHFVVTKQLGTAQNPVKKESIEKEYVVTFNGPKITEAKFDKNTVTLSGTDFNSFTGNPPAVKLVAPGGEETEVTPTSIADTKLVIPVEASAAGCWSVSVSVGGQEDKRSFFIPASPALVSAEQQGEQIKLTGKDLSVKDCDDKELALKFQLIRIGGAEANKIITPDVVSQTATEVVLSLPKKAKTGSWQVKMLRNDKEIPGSTPVPLQR
jgi:hypothetical protein